MIDSPRYKELYKQFQQVSDEKAKIDLLVEMGSEVRNFDVEEASKMADDIIHKSKVVAYTPGIGKALKLKGSCHWLKGEYEMGIETLKVGLNISIKIKDKRLEGRILYYMGNIYRDQGDFASVLTHFKSALSIYEALGDDYAQSVIQSSISNLLYDLYDYDSALSYALKCVPIFEQARNSFNLINLYNTLGNIYFKKENFEEAMRYFRNNLELTESETLANVLAGSGVGKVYYKMQDFDNARKHLSDALRQSEHMGNVEVQIICQFYLGRLYMDKGTYRQALQYLTHAFTLATEYNRRHDLMNIHEVLSDLYDKQSEIPKAFSHLKAYEQLKDEIFQQKIINELRNMQVQQQIELAQKEKDVAEKTAQLKHQFMANMSHEIRTPMNAIVGMTRLLLSKEHLPPQLRYLRAIEISANNLLVIINDILDLSKIEAGKIVIEKVDFSLSEVMQSVQDMLLLKAEEKNIMLRLNVEDIIPDRLVGDPTRLNQILINLAGNAVKFTERGFVEIRTTLRNQDKRLWLQFDIIDTGIGIAAHNLDTIFDSFTQAGADVTRKFGGTGLGLTISKQLSNLMGGEISVKSELGRGTTFTIVIPFEEASAQGSSSKKTEVTDEMLSQLNRMRILLAEDNEFNQMVAVETLKDKLPNVEVVIAENGQIAVDKNNAERYDLILMDVQMPVLDGVAATVKIRETAPKPACDIPIIAMTANVLQEDVQSYYENGMDEYVSKPFELDDLLTKMYKLVSRGGEPERKAINEPVNEEESYDDVDVAEPITVATPASPKVQQPFKTFSQRGRQIAEQLSKSPAEEEEIVTAPAEPEIAQRQLPDLVTDRNFLKQFTGGNPEKMKKYITIFMDNASKLLAAFDNNVKEGDYASIKVTAHSLKPQLSYMGIKEDVSHVFKLEQMAGNKADMEEIKIEISDLKRVCYKAFDELKQLL